jgi:hypothetical protein
MQSEGDCGSTLNTAIRQYGIPELGIHSDNAAAEVGLHKIRKSPKMVACMTTEPHSPWMNRTEREIGQFKTHWLVL